MKLKSERKWSMKSKRSRKVLKGEIKKKKGNRMGGIGKCEAELMFSKLKEHWGGLGSLPSSTKDF